jgi:hypothetical protein
MEIPKYQLIFQKKFTRQQTDYRAVILRNMNRRLKYPSYNLKDLRLYDSTSERRQMSFFLFEAEANDKFSFMQRISKTNSNYFLVGLFSGKSII